jgi:hypothetical protein
LLSAHCFARKYFWIVDSKQLSVFYVMTAYWEANTGNCGTRARSHMLGAASPNTLPAGLWTAIVQYNFCLRHGTKQAISKVIFRNTIRNFCTRFLNPKEASIGSVQSHGPSTQVGDGNT